MAKHHLCYHRVLLRQRRRHQVPRRHVVVLSERIINRRSFTANHSSSSSSGGGEDEKKHGRRCNDNDAVIEIPPPTWSIADLQLDRQHEPVSQEDLEMLAKRALLRVEHYLPAKQAQLRQDLGNLMHMIEQVQTFRGGGVSGEEDLDEAAIYDVPRNVAAAPLREGKASREEMDEAGEVWQSLLKPKTTSVGAHSYFVIPTKREKSDDKNEF